MKNITPELDDYIYLAVPVYDRKWCLIRRPKGREDSEKDEVFGCEESIYDHYPTKRQWHPLPDVIHRTYTSGRNIISPVVGSLAFIRWLVFRLKMKDRRRQRNKTTVKNNMNNNQY